MASEAPIEALRSALAVFAARSDLTPEARHQLALLLMGRIEGLGVIESGEIALSSAALAKMLGVATSTLVNWRRDGRRVGPPFVEVRHGRKKFVFYPVVAVRRWLSDISFEGSYRPDPSVLAAFGLTPAEREQVAA